MPADPRTPIPDKPRARVAVVGAGISGLAAAHALQGLTELTLFEAAAHFGGHAHTVDVTLPDAAGHALTFGVDTGFLVLNAQTSPNLLALLAQLDVPALPTDMAFSVQAHGLGPGGQALVWGGASLAAVFAQRANLWNPRFWRLLADGVRFNFLATRLVRQGLDAPTGEALLQPLAAFLEAQRFSPDFRDGCLLPLLGGLGHGTAGQLPDLPMVTLLRLCQHHGLLQAGARTRWLTIAQGSRRYVQAMVDGLPDARPNSPVRALRRDPGSVRVVSDARVEHFDAVVLACHSDQALALLGEGASADERAVLGAIRYQPGQAVLHTDASVLPPERSAWAAWNCDRAADGRTGLHCLLNRLQPLPIAQPLILSRDPHRPIDPARVIQRFDHAHPVFDTGAIQAQARLGALQGQQRTYFAGAWAGDGLHEAGLLAGLRAARQVMSDLGLRQPPSADERRRAALPGVFG